MVRGGGQLENNYFLWDRYNFALKTHFYTGNAILQTMGNPNQRFAWLLEPKSLIEKPYQYFYNDKSLSHNFNCVITHDEKLLDDLSNARFIYSFGMLCYFESGDILVPSENKFQAKCKNISMLVSGKTLTPLHLVRNTFADTLQSKPNIDIFGAYVNKRIMYKSESLDKYRYSIVIENEISNYYFTEKILDCFIAQCVPIYIGAPNIDKFFNTAGIIQIVPKDIDRIDKILKNCNAQDYESRLEAIKDNYYRSLKYINTDNHLYEELFCN